MKKIDKIKNRAWLFFNISWTIVYLIWRICCTVPTEYGIISFVAGIALLVVEIIGCLEAFVHYYNMHEIENYEAPVVPPEEYPDVDVFIATYNEPVKLLYKTVNGCVHMDYPDKDKVHIYICDDGHRPEVRALAERMGVNYLDREDHNGAKAGNLNHAMSVTSSPLIATFDADMIPTHDFLMVTVAYFVDQEIKNRDLEEKERKKIGFVQSPQSFYNPDLFQFNLFSENRIPNEQDYFYKDVQVSRNRSNSVIYGGSNTVIAREALNEVGGFYTESVTEDFATGILIQKKGYICYAINQVLASGLSPTELTSLINQRIRWARGCIQTGRKVHVIFSRHLTFAQKINYMASIWYWYASWKRLIYIMSPILFATFNIVVVKCTLAEVLIFWLPMYISSNVCLKMMSRNIRSTKWTNLYETTIFPFLMIPVLLETLGIRMKKFKVTKKGDKKAERTWPYAIPHIVLVVLSVIGIVKCVLWMFETGRIDYLVILFWLILNLFNLVMSVFFILGRKAMRNSERQDAEIPCKVHTKYEIFEGVTRDISEGGVAVWMQKPFDIAEDEVCDIELDTERYHAEVAMKIVSVSKREKGWCYVFSMEDLKDSEAEYDQLIYDREPSMPVSLDESLSNFDDLRLNISKRIHNKDIQNRKKARIPINRTYQTKRGESLKIMNFNYEFVLIRTTKIIKEPCEIELEKDLVLKLKKVRSFDEDVILYRVLNYESIYNNKESYLKLEHFLWDLLELEKKQEDVEKSKMSLKRRRMLAEDEFSELEFL